MRFGSDGVAWSRPRALSDDAKAASNGHSRPAHWAIFFSTMGGMLLEDFWNANDENGPVFKP
jgi:hypothetical protein